MPVRQAPASERPFGHNVFIMLLGTVAAQGIAIGVMPVLTRLYPPEAVGLQALFVSASTSLVIVATLRLDLAIVLPRAEHLSVHLVTLVSYQAWAVGSLVLIVSLLWTSEISGLISPTGDERWLLLLGPMVIFGALTQIGQGTATRQGRFVSIVRSNIAMSLTFAVVAVAIGVYAPAEPGIVVARLLGQAGCVLALFLGGQLIIRQLRGRLQGTTARSLWSTNRQFLFFNTPYSLVGIVSRDLPLYIFAGTGGIGLAAAYALARTVTLAPTNLASSAISRVFYREAAIHWGKPRLEKLAVRLTSVGLTISMPAFALLLIWGDELFSLCFGSNWTQAGQFAQLLAIPLWLALQNGWPERVFEVAGKQHISFAVQLTSDAVQAVVILVAYTMSRDPLLTIGCYAVSYTTYQVVYLFTVYRVASFSLTTLFRSLMLNAAGMAAVAAGLLAIRTSSPMSATLTLSVSTALIVCACAYLAARIWRSRS